MAAAPLPRPRVQRPKGKYADKTRQHVATEIRKSPWTGRSLTADLFRVAGNAAKAGVLYVVYYHTAGEPHKNGAGWKPRQYTVTLLPVDFAKELGFSQTQIREQIEAAVDDGLMARACGCAANKKACGPRHYQFRLLLDGWADMPNAFEARDGAFKGKVVTMPEVDDEVVEDEEDTAEMDGEDAANTRVTGMVRVKPTRRGGSVVLPGRTAAIGKMDFRGSTLPIECENRTKLPFSTVPSATESGIRFVIEDRAGIKAAKAAAAEVAKADAAQPAPAREDLIVELALRDLSIPPAMGDELLKLMQPADLNFLLRKVDEGRLRNAQSGKAYHTGFLKTTAKDAASCWPAEVVKRERLRATARDPLAAPQQVWEEPTVDELKHRLEEIEREIVTCRRTIKAGGRASAIADAEKRVERLKTERAELAKRLDQRSKS